MDEFVRLIDDKQFEDTEADERNVQGIGGSPNVGVAVFGSVEEKW